MGRSMGGDERDMIMCDTYLPKSYPPESSVTLLAGKSPQLQFDDFPSYKPATELVAPFRVSPWYHHNYLCWLNHDFSPSKHILPLNKKHTIFQPAEHPRIVSLPSTCPGGSPRRRWWKKWRVNGLIGFYWSINQIFQMDCDNPLQLDLSWHPN